MKNFKLIALATVFGFAACGGAFAQSVVVHERPADIFRPADQTGIQAFQSPNDQGSARAGDLLIERPADVFQPAGQGSQKVQKVAPTGLPAIQALQTPNDQGSARGSIVVHERPADVLTRDDPFFQPSGAGGANTLLPISNGGNQQANGAGGGMGKVQMQDTYFVDRSRADGAAKTSLGSLTGLGSTTNLFLNSRGGDQGNGLLLPAIRPNRTANTGAVGTPDTKLVGTPDTKVPTFSSIAQGAGGSATVGTGAALHLKPLAGGTHAAAGAGTPHVKVFSGSTATSVRAGQVAPVAAKGLSVTPTLRK